VSVDPAEGSIIAATVGKALETPRQALETPRRLPEIGEGTSAPVLRAALVHAIVALAYCQGRSDGIDSDDAPVLVREALEGGLRALGLGG
jgi:hypothetical protein